MNRNENLLNRKMSQNNARVLVRSTNGLPAHYLPCLQDANIIINRIADEKAKIQRKVEPIVVQSARQVTKSIKFNQIPDVDEAIPISSDEEDNTTGCKKSTFPKRIRYKTPFKPTKDTVRYMRKPIANSDHQQMLQDFAERKQTNPNLTLPDYCVCVHKSLIVDRKIMIPPHQFKAQMSQTDDTIQTACFTPGVKRELRWIQTGYVKLFANPAHPFTNPGLLQLFDVQCNTNKVTNADPESFQIGLVPGSNAPKTKFEFACDKEIDTNDHVYSKIPELPKKTVEIVPIFIDFDNNSMDPLQDAVNLTKNELTFETVKIEDQMFINSGNSDDHTVVIKSITRSDVNECEILGLKSDVHFT